MPLSKPVCSQFDRFGVDPKLKNVNVGTYLDRNDIRVAEVC